MTILRPPGLRARRALRAAVGTALDLFDPGRCGSLVPAARRVLPAESAGGCEVHQADGFSWHAASRGHFARREVRRVSAERGRHVGRVGRPGRDGRVQQSHQRQNARVAQSRDPHFCVFARRLARHVVESRGGPRERRRGQLRLGGQHAGRRAPAVSRKACRGASPSSTGHPTKNTSCTTRHRQAIHCGSTVSMGRKGGESTKREQAPTTTFRFWSPDSALI